MRLGPASSKVSRDHGSEVFYPAAYRLIGNRDPTFSQQVLDIAKAEGEPGIEPDGLLTDHGWKAISGVADLGHDGHLRPQFIADKPNNVTIPLHGHAAGNSGYRQGNPNSASRLFPYSALFRARATASGSFAMTVSST